MVIVVVVVVAVVILIRVMNGDHSFHVMNSSELKQSIFVNFLDLAGETAHESSGERANVCVLL